MPHHNKRHPNWIVLGAVAVLVSGCAVVGPDYVTPTLPETEVPNRWTSRTDIPPETEESAEKLAQGGPWWTELSDSALNQLVTEAFRSSPSLEAAVARLQQSRSVYAQAASAGAASIGGIGSAQRESTDSSGATSNSWFSANASWEIDLFGAVRRAKEGALAREDFQRATLADARVTLSADVTDAYLSHRACQSQLALSQEDVVSREATAKLTTDSIEAGFTAPYQGIRSSASVAEAKTQAAETRAQCERIENLLTRLTGVIRPTLMQILAEMPTGLDRLPVPKHFSIAIPGQALTQRPDVRAAERNLAAASADIGMAEADRYPRLSLNGTLGYAASGSEGSRLLSFGTWSFGPSLTLPIFDGGRRKAASKLATSRYEEALANFRAMARRAIQEVEDALTRYAAAHERAENARISALKYQQFFDTVELRYREGASNLLELEDARRAMLSAQKTLLGVQLERLQAWVALNRATGGAAEYEPGDYSQKNTSNENRHDG